MNQERKDLIRPVEFDPVGVWNGDARELVAFLRKGFGMEREWGLGLGLFIRPHEEPYFTCRVKGPNSLLLDIAYINQRDNRVKLHKERVVINYESVKRPKRFIKALSSGQILFISASVPMGPDTPDSIRIDSRGRIVLTGVRIHNWREKDY